MAIIGYNEQEVKTLTDSFQAKSQEVTEYLNSAFQNQIFNKMKDAWVCEEAKEFADLAVSDVKSLMDGIEQTNSHNFDVICKAGQAWAETVKAALSLKSWVETAIRPNDDSVITTTANGERGYDPDQCAQIKNNLQTILSETNSKLDALANTCNGSAFVGGSQQENLRNSIENVKKQLSAKIEELTNAFDANVKKTEEKYGQMRTNVESSFTQQN